MTSALRLTNVLNSMVSNIYGDHCPIMMPWFNDFRKHEPIHELRKAVLVTEWQLSKSVLAKIKLITSAAIWPVVSIFKSLLLTKKYGNYVREHYGLSIFKQILSQVKLANIHNISPHYYYGYGYELFQQENLKSAEYFLFGYELYLITSKTRKAVDVKLVEDKFLFRQTCRKYQIPSIPVIAEFSKGEFQLTDEAKDSGLPCIDLFAKPANSQQGIGAECWKYNLESSLWHRKELKLNEAELITHLKNLSLSFGDRYILQPRLLNHPELEHFSPSGLCTLRIVTCLVDGDNNKVEVLYAALKMPRGDSDADNLNAGGIEASIELSSGRAKIAASATLTEGKFEHHPDTGAKILGFELPLWEETKQLCQQAHLCLADFASIGWDVALTSNGPLIVEANLGWGVDLPMIPNQLPFGKTILPQSLLAELRKADC